MSTSDHASSKHDSTGRSSVMQQGIMYKKAATGELEAPLFVLSRSGGDHRDGSSTVLRYHAVAHAHCRPRGAGRARRGRAKGGCVACLTYRRAAAARAPSPGRALHAAPTRVLAVVVKCVLEPLHRGTRHHREHRRCRGAFVPERGDCGTKGGVGAGAGGCFTRVALGAAPAVRGTTDLGGISNSGSSNRAYTDTDFGATGGVG